MVDVKPRFGSWGASYVLRIIPTEAVAPMCIYLVAAWRLDLAAGWLFFGGLALLAAANVLLLALCNVELLNERGKTQADVYGPDRLVVGLYLLFTHAVAPAVAGLEAGRLCAGFHGQAALIAGLVLLGLSGVLENWATYVNRFYERSIRLQKDRGQTVVTRGPYALVRHPGYLGYLLRYAALPLALGSFWAIVPVTAGALCLVLRTRMEDALLRAGLPEYEEYARKVRCRLLPLVW